MIQGSPYEIIRQRQTCYNLIFKLQGQQHVHKIFCKELPDGLLGNLMPIKIVPFRQNSTPQQSQGKTYSKRKADEEGKLKVSQPLTRVLFQREPPNSIQAVSSLNNQKQRSKSLNVLKKEQIKKGFDNSFKRESINPEKMVNNSRSHAQFRRRPNSVDNFRERERKMIKNEGLFNSRIRTENCIVSDLIFQKKILDEKARHWNKIADHLAEERRLKATGLYQDRYHNISHDILMKKSLAMFGHRGR